jgi:ABC-type antimicrobial peptide transport system permease subunit
LWSLIFYIGVSWVRALSKVLMSCILNENITSQNRATVLSINSMMFRIVYGIMGPMMGVVADLISLQTAFLATGLIFMILCLLPMYKLRYLHAI